MSLCICHKYQNGEHSGSVVECLTQDLGAAGSSLTGVTGLCPWASHINPSLVLVQPRKTYSYITERLLMGCKKSNKQTKQVPKSHELAQFFPNIHIVKTKKTWETHKLGVIYIFITQSSIYGVIVNFFCYVMSHWNIDQAMFRLLTGFIPWSVSCLPVKNLQALIDICDDDAHTVCLWKETLCNNGENEAWFCNFKLQ